MKNLTPLQMIQVNAGSSDQQDLECAAKFAVLGSSISLVDTYFAGARGVYLISSTVHNALTYGLMGLIYANVKDKGE